MITASALALLWTLSGSAPTLSSDVPVAPGTRAGRWEALRREKATHLEPYRAGYLERQILTFEKAERPSIFSYNFHGLYPRIQGIAKGSKNSAGVRLWKPNIGGSELDLHSSAFHSVNGYEFYDLQFGRIPGADARLEAAPVLPLRSTKGDDLFELATIRRPEGRGWALYGSARYQHYTRLPYFGQGPDSAREDETTYLHQDAWYSLEAGYQLSRRLVATGSVGYLDNSLGRGEDAELPSIDDVFDAAGAPGLDDPVDFLRTTLNLVVDWRDAQAYTKRGAVVAFEASRYSDRADGSFSFDRYGVEARGYLGLGSEQRTLALRGYFSWDDPAAGARVPFYLQIALGGSHTLRGFRNFRFRGERLLLLQAEYRWEPVPAVELAAFVDSGTVGVSGRGIDLDELRTNWGLGLRLKTPSSMLMRVEWAKSSEDSRLLLRFSPAW